MKLNSIIKKIHIFVTLFAIFSVPAFAQTSSGQVAKQADPQSLKSSNWLTEKYRNDKLPGPTIGSRAGYYASKKHSFIVEEWAQLPLFSTGNFLAYYGYNSFTPFESERGGVNQVGRNDQTQELNGEYKLTEQIAVQGTLGWERVDYVDATGHREAFRAGVGAGTPYVKRYTDKLTWSFMAGPSFATHNTYSDWFTDAYVSYQITDFNFLAATKNLARRPMLNIEARMESYNSGVNRFAPYIEIGPTFSMITVNGNKLDIFAHYVGNHGNEFKMLNDDGALIGFSVEAMREYPYGTLPTDWQNGDVLSKVWGYYEMGWGKGGDYVTNFKINAQLYQFELGVPWTFYTWFQPRRYWSGAAQGINSALYNVAVGFMTPITLDGGWAVIGNHMPLQLGAEFFHRSDHTMNPSQSQVAANNKGADNPDRYAWEGSMNQVPRIFFSTAGWDSPYVYTGIYESKLAWVNTIDWRVSAGVNVASPSQKHFGSAEIGGHWNIATIYGYVPYIRGQYGYGAVSPGYSGEAGWQRPEYKVFIRYENQELDRSISGGRDNVWYGGFSLNL